MKNVLLIGDSIRMGYDEAVKTALEGKANVLFPEENCQFIYYVFRYFHEWLDRLGVRGEDQKAWRQAQTAWKIRAASSFLLANKL